MRLIPRWEGLVGVDEIYNLIRFLPYINVGAAQGYFTHDAKWSEEGWPIQAVEDWCELCLFSIQQHQDPPPIFEIPEQEREGLVAQVVNLGGRARMPDPDTLCIYL